MDEESDRELAALLGDPRVPIRVLIGLRDDQLAALDRFGNRVPSLFSVTYRLEGLTPAAARRAIEEPLERHRVRTSMSLTADPECVDAVVEELAELGVDERIEPVHLQLVVTRVAEAERAAGSTTLRAATLAELGGAAAIIERRFEETMAGLRPGGRELAARLVGQLVTPSGMTQRLTAADLAHYTGEDEARVAALLEVLAGGRFRVLRAVEPSRGARSPVAYELFHDTLRRPALEWARAWETRRLNRRNARLTAAVITLAAFSLGLALYVWSPTAVRRLELSALDTRFAVRGTQAPDASVALVGIDANTLSGLTRSDHAEMIDRLAGAGARTIAYDIIFDSPTQSRVDDEALAAAIARAGPRLVLATNGAEIVARGPGLRNCGAPLGNAAAGVQAAPILNRPGLIERSRANGAFAGLPNDPGGTLRRVAYQFPLGSDLVYPTFAWCAAKLARPDLALDEMPDGSRRALGTVNARHAWIDFAGSPGSYRARPFRRVFDQPESLRGKVVVVGYTEDPGDRHRTTVSSERPMAGVEVQANAIATLLRGAPIRDAAVIVDLLVLLVAAALPVAIWRAPWPWRLAGLAALGVALLAAFQLAFNSGVVLAVVPPVVALLASTLALLGRDLARRH